MWACYVDSRICGGWYAAETEEAAVAYATAVRDEAVPAEWRARHRIGGVVEFDPAVGLVISGRAVGYMADGTYYDPEEPLRDGREEAAEGFGQGLARCEGLA